MSEPEAASTQAELEALKALQADAQELERIEHLLDRFNAFETIVGYRSWGLPRSLSRGTYRDQVVDFDEVFATFPVAVFEVEPADLAL